MSTKVYGSSDDLIEFEGDVSGEVECYGTDDRERGVLVILSDGTLFEVKYGKFGRAIWGILVVHKGSLLTDVTPYPNEEKDSYSDIAHFAEGLKWAYAATKWGVVQ